MERLLDKYAKGAKTVLDVGSFNVNGTYREMCIARGMKYTGLDVSTGPNVDVVQSRRVWTEMPRFDLVISGQCLEHCLRPWEVVSQIAKVADRCILIAPFAWPVHGHPVDCFRFVPDGMRSMLNDAGFLCLEAAIPPKTHDCYGIGTRDTEELWTRSHFVDLINTREYKRGMEIGVKRGEFSALLMGRTNIEMVCIDPWSGEGGDEEDYQVAVKILNRFGDRCVVDRRKGVDAAQDYCVDFAYVDALHDYDSVAKDIKAAWSSISSGGMLAGHDYFHHRTRDFGVIQAVDEFALDKR
jgi:hypothetical protein